MRTLPIREEKRVARFEEKEDLKCIRKFLKCELLGKDNWDAAAYIE